MALLVPVAGQVGLQLLLSPASSTLVARAACTTLSVGYPVYSSFKTLQPKNPNRLSKDKRDRETAQWLTYWTVFGSISLVESVCDRGFCSMPGYYHAKLLFLLWLQLPQYQGARRLYQQFLQPFLAEHEEWVDARLATVQGLLVRPELVSLASGFRKTMRGAPLIGWFVQSPDEWDRPAKGKE
ncbi:hypothetical protein WJX74_003602 [Apatococcus lobatus]|uniref:HVA22-like protein n=2 Tax=Apatococcus TaxID=904362 RepID=A0AAW1Q5Y8_9CHLO